MGEVEVHALRGVDLDFYRGELSVLLGASGSGKSSLLDILGGLDTPSASQVLCGDPKNGLKEPTHTNENENELTSYRRGHVGFVFQFYNLVPSLTALENFAVVTEIALNPTSPE